MSINATVPQKKNRIILTAAASNFFDKGKMDLECCCSISDLRGDVAYHNAVATVKELVRICETYTAGAARDNNTKAPCGRLHKDLGPSRGLVRALEAESLASLREGTAKGRLLRDGRHRSPPHANSEQAGREGAAGGGYA